MPRGMRSMCRVDINRISIVERAEVFNWEKSTHKRALYRFESEYFRMRIESYCK